MIIADTTVGKWLPIMIEMDIISIRTSLMTATMYHSPLSTEPKEIIRAAEITPIQGLNVLPDDPFSRLALTCRTRAERYM